MDGHRGTAIGLVRLVKVVGATWHHLLEEERKLFGVQHAILIGVEAVKNGSQLVLIEHILVVGKSCPGASLIVANSKEACKRC